MSTDSENRISLGRSFQVIFESLKFAQQTYFKKKKSCFKKKNSENM